MKAITLTRGKVAILDDEDYETLSAFNWYALRDRRKHVRDVWYAFRVIWNPATKRGRSVQMQRDLLPPAKGLIVAFVNGDGLDNRRVNLVATTKSNSNRDRLLASRQLPKGVQIVDRVTPGFAARISVKNRNTFLGTFDTPGEASAAYEAARKKYSIETSE